MRLINSIRISIKLPVLMAATCLVSLSLVSLLALATSRNAMEGQAISKLEAVAASQGNALNTYFASMRAGLQSQKNNPLIADAFYAFRGGLRAIEGDSQAYLQNLYIHANPHPVGQRQRLNVADDGSPYSRAHEKYHRYFAALAQSLGIADILLIDADGRIVYTLAKNEDFAASLMAQSFQGTKLPEVFNTALADADATAVSLVDITPYDPAGAGLGFVATRILNEREQPLGVVVFAFDRGMAESILHGGELLGDTGISYILGRDGVLRSELAAGAPVPFLATTAGRDMLQSAFVDASESGGAVGEGADQNYQAFVPFRFEGIEWLLVAEQSVGEVLVSWKSLRANLLIETLVSLAVIIALTTLLSRSLSRPLERVSRAMTRVSNGEYDAEVPDKERGDEIGGIARVLGSFKNSLEQAGQVAIDARFRGSGFENASAPMMILNRNAEVSYANLAARHLLQTLSAELVNAGCRQLHGDIVGASVDTFHPAPAELITAVRNPQQTAYREILEIGDTYIELSANVVADDDGNSVGAVLEYEDVTRVQLDRAIVASIDAHKVVAEFDLSGRLLKSNSQFDAQLGPAGEGLSINQIRIADADADTVDKDLLHQLKRNGNFQGNLWVEYAGAADVILDGNLSYIHDSTGKPHKVLLVATDITKAHSEIEKARQMQRQVAADQQQIVDVLRTVLERLSRGDLTCKIEQDVAEEYRQICNDFNQSVSKLHDAVFQIVENATSIQQEASDISGAADDLAQRTEKQAATLEETAAALDEITSSVQSAAEGAKQANQIVGAATDHAESSSTIVKEAIIAMGEIETSSEQISKIISVIDEIAFQTNLLALNAGVEAARAGEAGRGFAVVASEVRALAQRSSDAAHEINQLISGSGQHVQKGVELVARTGEALEQIVGSISDISRHVAEISASAQEQSTGLGEVNNAVNALDRFTQQNAAMFEQTTAASHSLTQEVDTLTETVSTFRISRQNSTPRGLAAAPGVKPSDGAQSETRQVTARSVDGNLALNDEAVIDDDTGWEEF